ncbi:MAG: hypothetical protein R3A78_01195 [Polyangiales bacterium]
MTEPVPYTPPPPPPEDPNDELREAVAHLRKAAGIWLEKASKDPAVRYARDGAVEMIRKFGETAEPVAESMVQEATKVAEEARKRVSEQPAAKRVAELTESVASEAGRALFSVAGKLASIVEARRSSAPPPPEAHTTEHGSDQGQSPEPSVARGDDQSPT